MGLSLTGWGKGKNDPWVVEGGSGRRGVVSLIFLLPDISVFPQLAEHTAVYRDTKQQTHK